MGRPLVLAGQDVLIRFEIAMSSDSIGNLEEQAKKRKERLKALKEQATNKDEQDGQKKLEKESLPKYKIHDLSNSIPSYRPLKKLTDLNFGATNPRMRAWHLLKNKSVNL